MTTSPLASQRDWTDWLDPLLLKEYRQGAKGALFSWIFGALPFVFFGWLALHLSTFGLDRRNTFGLLSVARELAAEEAFWFALSFVLVVLIPLRLFDAVAAEARTGTLDPLLLTRLGAWRIICGKWLANVFLAMVACSIILPFLLIRYFLGGYDVVADLNSLLFIMLGSGLASSIAVGLSFDFARWFRFCVVLGGSGFIVLWLFLLRFAVQNDSERFGLVWVTLWTICLGSLTLLALGASRVSPSAVYWSTFKRLIMLLWVLSIISSLFLHRAVSQILPVFAFWAILFGLLDAVSETPVRSDCVARYFSRWGWAGRVGSLLFTPGWTSAGFFTVFIAGVSMLVSMLAIQPSYRLNFLLALWLTFPQLVLLPSAITVAAGRIPSLLSWLFIQAAILGVCILSLFAEAQEVVLILFAAFSLLFDNFRPNNDSDFIAHVAGAGALTLFSLIVLMTRSRAYRGEVLSELRRLRKAPLESSDTYPNNAGTTSASPPTSSVSPAS